MDQTLVKKNVFRSLQKELLIMQGLQKPDGYPQVNIGLQGIEQAFPGKAFPTRGIHEFISHNPESKAATNGFIAGLLGRLMNRQGYCLWVSAEEGLFPPALGHFGIAADKIIFVTPGQRDVLWTIEEGLKCNALTAVVGQIKELSFIESRRLQLAVEQSGVTGMIHRYCPQRETPVACVARWKIKPLASKGKAGMPGLGYFRWEVQLPRIRNGRPGIWQVEWGEDNFQEILSPGIFTELT
jgi:protein ImuA